MGNKWLSICLVRFISLQPLPAVREEEFFPIRTHFFSYVILMNGGALEHDQPSEWTNVSRRTHVVSLSISRQMQNETVHWSVGYTNSASRFSARLSAVSWLQSAQWLWERNSDWHSDQQRISQSAVSCHIDTSFPLGPFPSSSVHRSTCFYLYHPSPLHTARNPCHWGYNSIYSRRFWLLTALLLHRRLILFRMP